MRRDWAAQIWRGLVVAVLLVIGGSVVATPAHTAHAAANSSSDTLSLTLANGTAFTYGANTQPIFTVILTLATKPTANYVRIVTVTVDNSQTLKYSDDFPTMSADQLTYTFRVTTTSPYIPPSNTAHTAIASYSDPSTGSLQSDSVSFTVAKATPTVECTVWDATRPMDPSAPLHIRIILSLQGSYMQVDQTNRIYTVQFVGPTTVTTAPQQVDINNQVTVSAPSQYGLYSQVFCVYGGDDFFTPASGIAVGQDLLISRRLQLGGAEFFSNPTTLTSNQPTDIYVVFHAGAGLPTPTGFFNVEFGYSIISRGLTLGPNGDYLGHTTIPNISGLNHVVISYNGDPYYEPKDFSFPLTNPPIPGSASSSGSAQGRATATASATGTPGAATAVGEGTTPGATGAAASLATQPGSGGMVWLWAALGVLVVGGGAAGAVYVVRRSRRAGPSAVGVLDGERPVAGVGGQLNGVNSFGSGGGGGDAGE